MRSIVNAKRTVRQKACRRRGARGMFRHSARYNHFAPQSLGNIGIRLQYGNWHIHKNLVLCQRYFHVCAGATRATVNPPLGPWPRFAIVCRVHKPKSLHMRLQTALFAWAFRPACVRTGFESFAAASTGRSDSIFRPGRAARPHSPDRFGWVPSHPSPPPLHPPDTTGTGLRGPRRRP